MTPLRKTPVKPPLLVLATLLLAGIAYRSVVAQAPAGTDYVWLEAEATASMNVKPNVAGWGHPEFLSGEKWLNLSVDAEKVESEIPPEGALFRYAFAAKKDGDYEIWDRIGFEFVRSPFDWRVDGGEWKTVSPDELTTDLMELDTWCEVAWLKLGSASLSAGDHSLEIRLNRTKDAGGKYERILYASDAICIYPGHFRPHSKYKPDENYRTPDDEQASENVFQLPDASPGSRASVTLKGLWEVCRNDEQAPGEVATPMTDLPDAPFWSAIPVPGDKNVSRPDLLFAHRLWYRTKVSIPDSLKGRSFYLVFPQNNLNTTVYVNGVQCGFAKNPYARAQIDITKGAHPGVNEVWVGIRDAWYGYSASPTDPMKLRKRFNYPITVVESGFQDLAYPVWHGFQSGILEAPQLVAAGSVYASDVFVKPSVSKKALSAEVTLTNPSSADASGEIKWDAVNAKTGAVEKTFKSEPFSVKGGGEAVVNLSDSWIDPKLWWPDSPNLYRLRIALTVGGNDEDVTETTFGFREWTAEGKDFKLNGVVWPVWADLVEGDAKEEWLANYRRTNQRTMRLMGIAQGGSFWKGMPLEGALDFFDQNGVVVRRCGPLDGEMIGYNAIENDPELKKLYGSEIKMDLMKNWRDQMVAQVRGERNHPSIQLWSIENEWLYINCINLYGGLMDDFEREALKTSDAVRAVDPTRLTMTDGGGANKDQSMPVHGNHYVFEPNDSRYPDLAYDANPNGGGRGRWVWDEKRPRFIGEDYYATGINPADYAKFGGEAAFQGKDAARPAAGLIYRMLMEGYRWAGYAGWQLWLGEENASDQYGSNAPVAVFCRQWNWTFGSGRSVKRTFRIFNDSHDGDPLAFSWSLTFGGKTTAGETKTYRVPPGESATIEASIPMPKTAARIEGSLVLTLSRGGKKVFKDAKAVSVLPPPRISPALSASLKAKPLLVFDPSGALVAFLKSAGAPFATVKSLDALPASWKILIVGKDALSVGDSASSHLAALAAPGRTILVLEQKNPLKYQGLPAEMESTGDEGRIAFGEDMGHPVMRGLKQKDFFTWEPGSVVYRKAYRKPTRGGKSLLQCDNRLQDAALAEVPAGKGLLLLCQARVEETLGTNYVAGRLLANLIDYGATYQQVFRKTAAVVHDSPALEKALQATGLNYAPASDPLQAISAPGVRLAVISASPANLKRLAENLPKVRQFTEGGGFVVLDGLTPEGLADYDKIVGVNHLIRPFRRERVTFPPEKNPLTSGLTTGDIVMLSGERIFDWTSDEYVSSDEFSYVVDVDDVAPFAQFPDEFSLNMVNGMVSADAWKYIVNVPAPDDKPVEWTLKFPKAQTISKIEWIGNTFYYPVTRAELVFDGKETFSFKTKPSNDLQVFDVKPPRKGREITLRLAEWEKLPGKAAVTGLDNIRLLAERSPEFQRKVKPLLNIGAMVEYPQGSGGIVLCNLLFKDSEAVPVNQDKKRTILSTLLRNLDAPFAGGKSIFAGANLEYQPIDISKRANQYRDERGWFGDKAFTFAGMPTGRQIFAGVPYQIYDFPTSPVPTAIMLNGSGVPNDLASEVTGIPVHRKADALFFLQAARIDARRDEREIQEEKRYEMARYVVHYADGATASVPLYSEIDLDDYKQKTPTAIPGAQIAWTKPYAGTDYSAVAYSKQWSNPRPGVEIESVDLVYGADSRGVPALLALTAANAR